VGLILAASAAPASAEVFTATPNIADGQPGSLRDWVREANLTAAADTIILPAGGYTLAGATGDNSNGSGDLDIKETLTIQGAGDGQTIISGDDNDRVLHVLAHSSTELTLSGLTLYAGEAPTGAAVLVELGKSLSLSHVKVLSNHGTGATTSTGVVSVRPSNPFTLNVTDSTFDENFVGEGSGTTGRGVLEVTTNDVLTATISRTTFVRNQVGGQVNGTGRHLVAITAPTGSSVAVDHSDFRDNRLGGGSGNVNQAGGEGYAPLGVETPPGTETTVTDSSFTGNTVGGGGALSSGSPRGGATGFGGGIFVGRQKLTVRRTLFANNVVGGGGVPGESNGGAGYGGGINAGGADPGAGADLTVEDSTFRDNRAGGSGAPGGGGGIAAKVSALRVTGTTFAGNDVGPGLGGAITAFSENGLPAPFVLLNDTFHDNVIGTQGADSDGGAAFLQPGTGSPPIELRHLTVTNNSASSDGSAGAGGISLYAPASVGNSIFADNLHGTASSHCALGFGVSITSLGGNLETGTRTCDPMSATADPMLGPLQDNGGFAPTRALMPGSPAIDLGVAGSCAATDQRGVARPAGAGCDSGAVEAPVPGASTGEATAVGPTTATVPGTVTTRGESTSYVVEYGPDAAHLNSTASASLPSAADPTSVSVELTGLTPATGYVYELVATNAYGTTLTTAAAPPVALPVALRIVSLKAGGKRFRRGKPITFSYELTRAARVRLSFVQLIRGHRKTAKGRCTTKRKRGRRCTILRTRGTLTQAGKLGKNKLKFRGKFKREALPAGTYRAVLRASAAGQTTVSRRVGLRIVKPRSRRR
jgi:hypothetical protein